MNNGWIKLHRNLVEWEWYQDSKMVHLFLHMILKANHKFGNWKGIKIEPGQFISGRKVLSFETGISERSIRTCINKLKSTSEVTTKTTNKYTIFTLNNWNKYQLDEVGDQQNANKRPASDQQVTTNKNDKKKKKFISPTLEEVKAYCIERNNNIDPQYFIDSNAAKGWLVGKNKTPMKDWKAAIRTWEKNTYSNNTEKIGVSL